MSDELSARAYVRRNSETLIAAQTVFYNLYRSVLSPTGLGMLLAEGWTISEAIEKAYFYKETMDSITLTLNRIGGFSAAEIVAMAEERDRHESVLRSLEKSL